MKLNTEGYSNIRAFKTRNGFRGSFYLLQTVVKGTSECVKSHSIENGQDCHPERSEVSKTIHCVQSDTKQRLM